MVLNELECENTLEHYGVLGMRWGVRKGSSASSGSSRSSSSKQKPKSDSQKMSDIKKKRLSDVKKRSTLSTKQLQDKVNRLELEKRLQKLTDSEVAPGRAAVKECLTDIGKQSIKELGKKYSVKYGEKGIDALIDLAIKQATKGRD